MSKRLTLVFNCFFSLTLSEFMFLVFTVRDRLFDLCDHYHVSNCELSNLLAQFTIDPCHIIGSLMLLVAVKY